MIDIAHHTIGPTGDSRTARLPRICKTERYKRPMEHKKPGRPRKGDRRMAAFRLPNALIAEMKTYAAAHGMTVTDLVGEAIADRIDASYQPQEGLPLNKVS